MLNKKMCPVCGYKDLDEAPYDEMGCASYNIFPSCGTEFGYDDSNLSHTQLRKQWIASGMRWWSINQEQPCGWDSEKQLESAFHKHIEFRGQSDT